MGKKGGFIWDEFSQKYEYVICMMQLVASLRTYNRDKDIEGG